MDAAPRRCELLDELDARQDDALAQLDALNAQLETLIAEYAPSPPQSRAA